MDRDTDRFISAFNSIEQHLRQLVGAAEHRTFSDMLHEAGHGNALVHRLSSDLRQLAELRNFIVHRYREHAPLALPSELSLQKIERIRDALLKPATLHSLFHKVVYCCRPSDPIGAVAQTMHQHDVRQLPVYEEQTCVGLLTAQTLTRWLAARLATGVGLVEEESVANILQYQSDPNQHEFADHRATVTDAFNRLEKHFHAGRPLRAIILTPHGRPSEMPTGIVTAGNIAVLLKAVGL
ncbi:CBS domain-containing protein [Blastopirellula sp. JC732]|uniref:CBS domain-containing protein n=1 Tax=Blastopirellula sediminis TaxID=2894196 RepID=A0A9X1MLW0_9BACT|nr:CBS domain-containing protein [Blastopirellula sediminis]MCC9608496.1 CBS domain-containing protein [Blastopirellula sediminis]MCC9628727.1 CBS domain-containing protein [Blastopirellula sediminis]